MKLKHENVLYLWQNQRNTECMPTAKRKETSNKEGKSLQETRKREKREKKEREKE